MQEKVVQETVESLFNNAWIERLFWSAVAILVSVLIYCVVSKIISYKEKKNSRVFSEKKNKTYLRMLKSITRYVLIILTCLTILQIFGVDTSSLLAGVGVIGLIVGFAIQDALKDIIKGFDIISDNYYRVGDYIKYGDIEFGKVLSVGLKTTKIEDVMTGNIVSIANRNIDQVAVVSGDIYLTIPIPYEIPIEKADKAFNAALKEVQKDDGVKSVTFYGLTRLNDSSMNYLVGVICNNPGDKLRIRRFALRKIIKTLEEHKISIPYPQLDVHTKK